MQGGLDLDWIAPGLALGAAFRAVEVGELRDLAIRRVVDLRAESCDDTGLLARHRIALLHLPTADRAPLDPADIARAVPWVCRALDGGEKVFLHCQHGIGRSAALACCVLVARGREITEALAHLVRARPCVSPSPDQLGGLIAWATERGGPPVSWAQVVSAVYRHAA